MEGAKVYVPDESTSWRKGTVVGVAGGGRYRVEMEPWECSDDSGGAALESIEVDASKLEGGTLPFQNAGMPKEGFPDMTLLDHLHEAALLHNLRMRFFAGACPYTYTADIVIAVNPYKWLPELYSDETRKEYLVFDRSKLPPHVYATSSAAYSDLQEQNMDQSILVSGESGAGKTETVKILMGHLALIASSDDTVVIRRIVESNPLLESFGNAQTVRNDNSSRFGKFIELELNGACRLVGSRCSTFLLEKSRVVGQDAGERNYHIFYQMLAAEPRLRSTFGLGRASRSRDAMKYTCMGRSPVDHIEGKHDGARFADTIAALAIVGVEGEGLTNLLSALAGVLLVGQLTFDGGIDASSQDATSAFSEAACEEAADVASALQVDAEALERALTQRTLRTRDESFIKRLSPAVATATCDALAKELYTRLFDWLVARICEATRAATAGEDSGALKTVGLLDIFGFESFEMNRFEQLCINYANEKLQQKFTSDIFKAVQQEYSDEGIPWDRVEFKDNTPILALIEAKLGIIAMLNEECVRPKGSDENFVSKLISVHRGDPAFSTPRVGAHKEFQFSIRHYAGTVMYTSTGWLDRNKDVVSDDLLEMMRESKNPLICKVFADPELVEAMSSKPSHGGEGKAKGCSTSVATKFKASLAQLMETVQRTRTQYVRCIKPNKVKSAVKIDNPMVIEQLRCAGVVEAIRISRAGFPARMALGDFARRFAVLARQAAGGHLRGPSLGAGASAAAAAAAADMASRGTDSVGACRALMAALAPGEQQQYEIGRTRFYFKAGVLEQLEERRALLRQAAATALARRERGRQARRRYLAVQAAALRLQSLQRMNCRRAAYQRTRGLAIRCQAYWRGFKGRRHAAACRRLRAVTCLQAHQRRRVAMNDFRRCRAAAGRLQAAARRMACRRRYLANLAEFREQAKLVHQVRALQARLEAQEKAAVASVGPSTEVLEALQTLSAENAKLRDDLERTRADNLALRRENQELRASQSTKTDWLNFMRTTQQPAADGWVRACTPEAKSLAARKLRDDLAATRAGSKAAALAGLAAASPAPAVREPLKLYAPLSEFWGDIPCAELPMMMSGTEVHVKFGEKVLAVDESNRSLVWTSWMSHSTGYLRSMAFFIERRAEKGHEEEEAAEAEDIGIGDPWLGKSIGLAFALRAVLTGQYVCSGGLLAGYCMQVTGDRPEDAAVFTFVPQEGSQRSGSVESHLFALRMLKENKVLSLRKDGYVTLTAVADADNGAVDGSMAAAVECLLPCTSYEIMVSEKQIGIVVSKELPLRVIDFRSSENSELGDYEPGPAERTGRVHLGDIVAYANGLALEGVPRQEALAAIADARPVTLGFQVGAGEAAEAA